MWQSGEERRMPKKKKRDMEAYPALKKELNLKTRQDLIDYDYVHKLSEEDRKWLNKFTEEYVVTDFDRDNLNNNIHNTEEYKSESDHRNYLRTKIDAYSMSKAGTRLQYIEDLNKEFCVDDYENMLIDKLDKKK